MKEIEFRSLSSSEVELLNKLFTIDFVGRSELLQQIPTLLAKTTDTNGSLQFKVQDSIISQKVKGPVVEGRYPDSDANEESLVRVNVLLHVKGGKLSMLEIFKDDNSEILKKPVNAEALQLFTRFPVR